jgi:hypothetical protein
MGLLQTCRNFAFFALGAIFLFAPTAVRAQAASQHQSWVIYAAAGSALGLGAARVGYNKWEVGVLNQKTLGFAQQFFSDETVYASIGFGIPISYKAGAAVYGSLGWEPRLFWKVYFRTEMNASAATTGQTGGEVAAGLSLRF